MGRLLLYALLSAVLVSSSHATVIFDQPHNGTGTLHKSSWYAPDGLDGDVYCWDSFTLAANAAISEVHWRGGYEVHPTGSGQAPVASFDVAIYRSIAGNSQPDMGAGGMLVRYTATGNAGEIAAGAFGGVQLYDYAFTLPSPFQAAAGTTYWVQIEAAQGAAAPSYAPDWGLAVGTGGNGNHFQRTTGGTFQYGADDLAFSLLTSGAPTVTISASESPVGAGTLTGAGAYPIGSTVSLQATANAGWGFVNWTEGGTQVSASAQYTFTAAVNRTLVGNFDTAYTITTSVYPSYGGTVTGAGVYTNGATVTLVATPVHGFVFDSWSDGGTTATHSFPAVSNLQITAFFRSAPDAVTFDFDGTPAMSGLPIDVGVNGVVAHFDGGFSVQQVGTLGIAPAGFSGNCLYPSSVYQSDLLIRFSEAMTDFSILYAVDELGCDTSARMRVNAFLAGVFVGTNTMVATAGTYPSATLGIAAPSGFDSVVVHWDAPGTLCQDYGPIFFADNVTVTRLVPPLGVAGRGHDGTPRLLAPAPNPFQRATRIGLELSRAGDVRLKVYDLSGRLVRTLVSGNLTAGQRSVVWNGVDDSGHRVRAGVYVLRLESAGDRDTRRMVLTR